MTTSEKHKKDKFYRTCKNLFHRDIYTYCRTAVGPVQAKASPNFNLKENILVLTANALTIISFCIFACFLTLRYSALLFWARASRTSLASQQATHISVINWLNGLIFGRKVCRIYCKTVHAGVQAVEYAMFRVVYIVLFLSTSGESLFDMPTWDAVRSSVSTRLRYLSIRHYNSEGFLNHEQPTKMRPLRRILLQHTAPADSC